MNCIKNLKNKIVKERISIEKFFRKFDKDGSKDKIDYEEFKSVFRYYDALSTIDEK